MSAYVPLNWVDGTTPLNEANLDHMEQGIDAAMDLALALDALPKIPTPLEEGEWLTVSGGAMVWAPAPAGGGGGGLDWEGAWAAGTPYVKGDVVTKDGVVYGAVNDSTGQTPPVVQPINPALTPIPILTALPSSPFDGQEIILIDATPNFFWRLRYVSWKPGPYKWVFLGGTPLSSFVDNNHTTASTTYVPLTSAGPAVTLPLPGDYEVEIGCRFVNATGPITAWMSYDIGATPAVDADGLWGYMNGATNNVMSTVRKRRKAGLSAVTLTAKYRAASGTQGFETRWMTVTPVAVG